jgi:hypothetical protein
MLGDKTHLAVRCDNVIHLYSQGDSGWNYLRTITCASNAKARRELNEL